MTLSILAVPVEPHEQRRWSRRQWRTHQVLSLRPRLDRFNRRVLSREQIAALETLVGAVVVETLETAAGTAAKGNPKSKMKVKGPTGKVNIKEKGGKTKFKEKRKEKI